MHNLRKHPRHADAPVFDSSLNVMFLAAFPLLLWFFQGSLGGIASALLQMGLFSIALRLIYRGQRIQRVYDLSEIAKKPVLPYKILGSTLIGVVVFLLAGHQFMSLLPPAILGVVATGLSLTAFGLDPLKDKGQDNPELMNRLAAEHRWDAAEDALAQVTDRIELLDDPELTLKSDATRAMVMRLMRSFGTNPRCVQRIGKLVERMTQILRNETQKLEQDWHSDKHLLARKRFLLKLDVLSESFETHAREGSERTGRDAFDLEADLLLDRMPHETAA
ncbi:hypothetical protein TRP8649_04063 [Pelagimonas phthalicica]|uniref:5-bromo-4-chloroindolyl phosphate hydrolysis protein n=1 Tax=Pelagimonas phthalicica TaxID=1037362 RepID=A0A238JHQ0_9RHOB|nr:hypothetical protein [Pelagimonas phthalicica]TDS89755.1 hypothetical protein CLV87_3807 [Pelagimonas phthalicica]SMX29923.1 hypothetical protein TRP8649_04063 [Pelagimonas phthalicica]